MATNGYEAIASSHDVYVKIIEPEPEKEYLIPFFSVHLLVNYPNNDLLLTFEGLDQGEARTLKDLFQKSYLSIYEEWSGPFRLDEYNEEESIA